MMYFDYASATPLDPHVLEAMQPYFKDAFGNASSIHRYGQRARKAVDSARTRCIDLIGAFSPHEIIFTGSGTESANLAILGAAFARQDEGKHLVISAIEHAAVREAAHYLRDHFDFELTEVPPDAEGLVSVDALAAALRPDTVLVSVIYANNEVGTVQPIKKIAQHLRQLEHPPLLHTDACQAPGYLDIHVEHLGVDLMTLNGSKIYGPKGVGLLYKREGVDLMPLIHGGGQEFRMRGGTENVANIVGFATALERVLSDSKAAAQRIASLRDRLLDELLALPHVTLNGSRTQRLANNLNVHVKGSSGESLVMRLDIEGLAASSGSACSSGKLEPSHVLLAMGQSKAQALASLRLTLGRPTSEAEIQAALPLLKRILSETNAHE